MNFQVSHFVAFGNIFSDDNNNKNVLFDFVLFWFIVFMLFPIAKMELYVEFTTQEIAETSIAKLLHVLMSAGKFSHFWKGPNTPWPRFSVIWFNKKHITTVKLNYSRSIIVLVARLANFNIFGWVHCAVHTKSQSNHRNLEQKMKWTRSNALW